MTKKRNCRQKHQKSVSCADTSDEELVNVPGKNCQHITRGIHFGRIKKSLKFTQNVLICNGCLEEKLEDMPEVWLCLQCGYRGCGRTSEKKHGLQHFKTLHSDCHALVLSMTSSAVWCYECDDEISLLSSRILKQCVEFIMKAVPSFQKTNTSNVNKEATQQNLQSSVIKETVEQKSENESVQKIKKTLKNTKEIPEKFLIKGLRNLGNTCFFNAVMQNLNQTSLLLYELKSTCTPSNLWEVPELVFIDNEFTTIKDKDNLKLSLPRQWSLTNSLFNFFEQMNAKSNLKVDIVNPALLFREISKKCPQFCHFQQQDSHELLRQLLDNVRQEEIKRQKKAILRYFELENVSPEYVDDELKKKCKAYGLYASHTIIEKVFGGLLISTVLCEECKMSSQIFEPFMDLSLPLFEEKQQENNDQLCGMLDGGKQDLKPLRNCKSEWDVDENSHGEYVLPKHKTESEKPSKHQEKKLKQIAKKEKKKAKNLRNRKSSQNSNISNNANISETNEVNEDENSVKDEMAAGNEDESSVKDELAAGNEDENSVKDELAADNENEHLRESGCTIISKDIASDEMDESQNEQQKDGQSESIKVCKENMAGVTKLEPLTDKENCTCNAKQIRSSSELMEIGLTNEESIFEQSKNNSVSAGMQLNEKQNLNGCFDHGKDITVLNEIQSDSDHSSKMCLDLIINAIELRELQMNEKINSEACIDKITLIDSELKMNDNSYFKVCVGEDHGKLLEGFCSGVEREKEYIRGLNKCEELPISLRVQDHEIDVQSDEDEDVEQQKLNNIKTDPFDILNNIQENRPSLADLNNSLHDNRIQELTMQIKDVRIRRDSDKQENLLHSTESADENESQRTNYTSPKSSVEETSNENEDNWSHSVSEQQTKEWILKSLTTLKPRKHISPHECSIYSCINHFTKPELLTGNNKFRCENCTELKIKKTGNKKDVVYSNASKQILIFSPPAVLTLHLKRFQQAGMSLRKVNRFVEFPLVLDLAPFCSSASVILPHMTSAEDEVLYSLYGIVEHSGRLTSGHYTAYVKANKRAVNRIFECQVPLGQCDLEQLLHKYSGVYKSLFDDNCSSDSAEDNRQWFYISDSHVKEVSEAQVLKCQAYLLFYERIK